MLWAMPSSARCSRPVISCAARDKQAGQRTGLVARLLGLAGTGLMLYTAWLGGKLVEELGEAVKPVMEQHDKQQQRPQPVGQESSDGALAGPERTMAMYNG